MPFDTEVSPRLSSYDNGDDQSMAERFLPGLNLRDHVSRTAESGTDDQVDSTSAMNVLHVRFVHCICPGITTFPRSLEGANSR